MTASGENPWPPMGRISCPLTVRLAAILALAKLGEAEHAIAVRHATNDADAKIAAAATTALEAMSERLDRDLGLEGEGV